MSFLNPEPCAFCGSKAGVITSRHGAPCHEACFAERRDKEREQWGENGRPRNRRERRQYERQQRKNRRK